MFTDARLVQMTQARVDDQQTHRATIKEVIESVRRFLSRIGSKFIVFCRLGTTLNILSSNTRSAARFPIVRNVLFCGMVRNLSINVCSRRLISSNYRGGNIIVPNVNKTLISSCARSLDCGSESDIS